jgi:hypothetical protein
MNLTGYYTSTMFKIITRFLFSIGQMDFHRCIRGVDKLLVLRMFFICDLYCRDDPMFTAMF